MAYGDKEDKEEEEEEKSEKRKKEPKNGPKRKKRPNDARRICSAFEQGVIARERIKIHRHVLTRCILLSQTNEKKNRGRKKIEQKSKKKKRKKNVLVLPFTTLRRRAGERAHQKRRRVRHDDVEEFFNDHHETREEEYASRSVVRVGRVDVRVRRCNEGQRSRRESFKDGTGETLGASFAKFDIVGKVGVF